MEKLLVFSLVAGLVAGNYYGDYYCKPGTDVMVHLFEWKWTDVQAECPLLADAGYCAVQVSPPQEHVVLTDPGREHPWYQRYQVVSYKLESRSGDRQEFINMVETCNDVGVSVYADVIINHMTGSGTGIGNAGSSWDGDTETYPEVPYTQENFHGPEDCGSFDMNIHDYTNADEVRYCRLYGLRDLRASDDYVQQKIADYLNDLVDIGIAGFRVDAAKHNFPVHIEEIMERVNHLPTTWFPQGTKPFLFNEVISMFESEAVKGEDYEHIGRVTEFDYGFDLGETFRKFQGMRLANLRSFGEGSGLMKNETSLVFVDNHDTQRGHGPGGLGSIVNFHDPKEYKMANAFMLAWNYGHARVMSSYNWPQDIQGGVDLNDWMGPPSDQNGNTDDVDCASDDWICEHRWNSIINMVKFHNLVMGEPISNWFDNNFDFIAFSRGDKGLIAINNEFYTVTQELVTDLPDGDYCDVITCDSNRPQDGVCTGSSECKSPLTVAQGRVTVTIEPDDDNAVIAIHV